jgi:hypothetical protein
MMSNYLFAMGTKARIRSLHQYFITLETQTSSEITIQRQSNGLWILVIQRNDKVGSNKAILSSSQKGITESFFFKGWFQDHTQRSIIFGNHGALKYFQELNMSPMQYLKCEGSYILAAWDNNHLNIQNDLFSLLPVVYCSDQDIIIASDSLLVLSKCRKHLGLPCSLNREVALSKGWRTHGIASAPLSTKTIVDEIRILPMGGEIRIDIPSLSRMKSLIWGAPKLNSLDIVNRKFRDLLVTPIHSYSDALKEILKRMYGLISQFTRLQGTHLRFGLSGGLDSRVLLGIILSSTDAINSTYISSSTQPNRQADLDVATELSKRFQFKLNDIESWRKIASSVSPNNVNIDNNLGLWALANLGLYDSIFLVDNLWNPTTIIEMGGQGAEALKDTWGGISIQELISQGVYPEVRQAIVEQMYEALNDGGVEPNSPDAVKWHHLAFKSAFHNGRGGTRSAVYLRPFLQQAIFTVSVAKQNLFKNKGRSGPGICHDLLILLDQDLATHRYESDEKNITLEYANKRLEELGGETMTFGEEHEYTVYGSITEIISGPPYCFMGLVDDFHPQSDGSRILLQNRVREVWEKLQDRELRRAYKHLNREAIEHLDSQAPLSSAGVYAARICSLSLVDESELIDNYQNLK